MFLLCKEKRSVGNKTLECKVLLWWSWTVDLSVAMRARYATWPAVFFFRFLLCTRQWAAQRRAAQNLWRAHCGKYLCCESAPNTNRCNKPKNYPYFRLLYLTIYSYHLKFIFLNSSGKAKCPEITVCWNHEIFDPLPQKRQYQTCCSFRVICYPPPK